MVFGFVVGGHTKRQYKIVPFVPVYHTLRIMMEDRYIGIHMFIGNYKQAASLCEGIALKIHIHAT